MLSFTNWVSLSAALGALYNSIPILALSRFADGTAVSTYAVGAALAGWVSLMVNTGMTVLLPEAMAALGPQARADYLKIYLPDTLLAAIVFIPAIWLAAPGILTVAGTPLRCRHGCFPSTRSQLSCPANNKSGSVSSLSYESSRNLHR